ncbi:MAG: phospholipase D family protein [Planctomycetales bacterium]|nr:phospholipase D family protein [Planctomycetales bacterium]
MKYLDSGWREPAQALGHWLEVVLQDGDVAEVRWQSGFYAADGLGFLAPTLDRIREEGGRVVALVGSNNGDTLRGDVARLVSLLGIPRPGAHLGVVSFTGAFFHPKTYHLTRRDGSQAAYVGSANLTSAGVGSLHVEAGVLLDTRPLST